MTLIEISVVLVIIAVLSVVLTPMVSSYVEESRMARAQSDVRAIGEGIIRLEKDLGRYPMFGVGSGSMPDTSANLTRLDGPGTEPVSGTDDSFWRGTTGAVIADTDCPASCTAGSLNEVLLQNTSVGYPTTTSFSKPFKWKGPYLEVAADPWGTRYEVNILNCKRSSADACFVISAGPDGAINTNFNKSKTAVVTAGGDDLLFRIK